MPRPALIFLYSASGGGYKDWQLGMHLVPPIIGHNKGFRFSPTRPNPQYARKIYDARAHPSRQASQD